MKKIIGKLFLKLINWEFKNDIPRDLKKYVLVAAPHTSNFDFVLLIVCLWAGEIKGHYLIKKEHFKWPFSVFLKWTGAIAVDRDNINHRFVDQLKNVLKEKDEAALIFTPEGTRSFAPSWKTGFHRVAATGNYPIVAVYADYDLKEVGIAEIMQPSSDLKKDLKHLETLYSKVIARYPQQFNKKFL